MPWLDLLLVVGGLVLLSFGADWLVGGATQLALRLGVSALVVGLTVVAFGTSLPEFIVSVKASNDGLSSLAIGNVVGSNICNLALVVAVAALLRPFRAEKSLLKRDFPWMLVASLVLVAILVDGKIERWQGAVLAVALLVYTWRSFVMSKREQKQGVEDDDVPQVNPSKPLWLMLFMIVVGLAGLAFGADWLVRGASNIATAMGVSEAVIGLTLVAFGTSVPELATTIAAAARKRSEIAIGNAIGSNIFNILFVLGVSSLVAKEPLQRGEVSNLDLTIMVAIAVISFAMLALSKLKLHRWHGAVLLALYLGYMIWLAMGAPGKDLF